VRPRPRRRDGERRKDCGSKTADAAEAGGRKVAGATGTAVEKAARAWRRAGEKVKSRCQLDINSATEKELEALPGSATPMRRRSSPAGRTRPRAS
jgi:hypothetical protein